jgi:hypothetical protein
MNRRRNKGSGTRGRAAAVLAGLAVGAGIVAPGASAQELADYDYANLRFSAIGAEAVFVDPSQNETTVGVGLRADLGWLGPFIRVVPRLAYWKADVSQSSVDELEAQLEKAAGLEPGTLDLGKIQRSAYVIGMDLQWTLPEPAFAPYLGIGVDGYVLNDDGDAIQGTFLDDTVVTLGASAVGGLEYDFPRGLRLYAELRGTLVSDARNLAVQTGVAWRF